ncbi:hypothetical protein EYF80_011057 [Liparis tanakae]|uniref:Uncharacterized protein n=1 Tax=Liparis tanakae TaxID=230148 RepID=A0A4Z2INB7_9TELE|nr:hypothetical protein EYF80_011057 [Liparis tanakae]
MLAMLSAQRRKKQTLRMKSSDPHTFIPPEETPTICTAAQNKLRLTKPSAKNSNRRLRVFDCISADE